MELNRKSRILTLAVAGLSIFATTGCATKNYVRKETAPVINKINELDELTARNSKDIRDVDARAQQGIQGVNQQIEQVNQKTASAQSKADEANQIASTANSRVDVISNQVANLDNYKPVIEASVHFGFDKANLTKKAKSAIDELAKEIPNTKNYIVEIIGGADSVGNNQYNYDLSRRRAASVVQYLAQEHNVPAHKISIIGIGEDKQVPGSRAENRRVEIRLLSSNVDAQQPGQPAATSQVRPQ